MKYQTFVAVGDNHGDKCDPIAFNGLKQFLKEFKPQHRIHLGDCFDFRSIRRGVSNNDAESHESLYDDVEQGIEFIDTLRPTAFLYGNHEDRLSQMYTNANSGVVRDYALDLDEKIKGHLKANDARKSTPIMPTSVCIVLDLFPSSMVTLVTDTQSKNTLLIMADPEGPLSWDTFTELVQPMQRSTEGSSAFPVVACASKKRWNTPRTVWQRLNGVLAGLMVSLKETSGKFGRLIVSMTAGFGPPK